MLNAWILLWKKQVQFKFYILLLLACFVKQIIHYTALVDSNEYLAAAINLKNLGILDSCLPGFQCDHWLHETRRTLGYPLLILLSGFMPFLMLIIQCTLASFIPVLSIKCMNLLGVKEKNHSFFLWLLLLYPLQFFYANLLLPELLCQFLMLLLFFQFLENKWTAVGFIITGLILLKPVFLLLLPFAAIAFLWKPKANWGMLLPFLCWISVSAWNQKTVGVWHYSSIGTENFWEYNVKALDNATNHHAATIPNPDAQLKSLDFKEKMQTIGSWGSASFNQNRMAYLGIHFKGCVLALVDPGRYDIVAFFELKNQGGFMGIKESNAQASKFHQPWYLWCYIVFFMLVNMVKWIFVVPALFNLDKKLWIIVIAVGLVLAATGPVGSARYLFPFMPIVFIFATLGYQLIRTKFEKNTAVG